MQIIFIIEALYVMQKISLKLYIRLVSLWLILCIWLIFVFAKWWKKFNQKQNWLSTQSRESDWDLHILTSIDDEVVGDSMWCWTFQLVWNDMVNEVVKKDVKFNPQLKIVENLNKQTFTNKQLSPNSYYSKFWLLTLDLKEEIENWIKEKFNETSDILEQWADWSDVPQSDDFYEWKRKKKYWFYAMLKKIFKFENVFDQLDNWKFDNKYDDVKYFWIKWSSSSKLYRQVYVYYYNSDKDFAVALRTKEWEDVILAGWIWWNSFIDVYNNILENEKKYEWKHNFTSDDYLKVPELKVKTLTEFSELENKEFYANDWDICKIEKALQTIELKLDKEWWEIKSEARMAVDKNQSLAAHPPKVEHRYFYFDKPYVMFLKEADKDLPYFAAQISNITLFQQ